MKKLGLLFLLCLTACGATPDKQVNAILSMARPTSIIGLQGKTTEQVREMMGEPTFVRKEEPNQSWVFKAPDCALFVFFNQEGISSYTQTKGSCDKQVARQLLAERSKI